ncbi:hypothetical protein [Rhizobium sp. LjRoot254]|uniref:hypothetical protein n=1 Tax=Rhizobium sp. LjRoot254 TaxID=3342297 RepID=UPI003ED11152
MATIQTIDSNFTTPIQVIDADDILIINQGVQGVLDVLAINAETVADNRTFDIRGRVTANNGADVLHLGLESDPSGSSGGQINLRGSGRLTSDTGTVIAAYIQDVEIIINGNIKGQNGIIGNLLGGSLVNKGDIVAVDQAFFSTGGSFDFTNRGLVKSTDDITITLTGNGNNLFNYGDIRGLGAGPTVFFNSEIGNFNTCRNNGGIFSADIAIQCGGGNDQVFNDGFVKGDIMLGDGFDQFSCKRGTVDGAVYGGADNDTYNIFSRKISIVEMDGGGIDSVFASRNTKLQLFTENLFLLGGADLIGSGNAEDNDIYGNKGDNLLTGFDGADLFSAGRGNDKCFGGMGPDTFMIYSDSGKDRVMDFSWQEDILDVDSFGYDTFSQVMNHVIKIKGGVMFSDGGARIELPDVKLDQLGEDNFHY